MEGKDMLLSELMFGFSAAKKLHTYIGKAASPPSSSSPGIAETNEILLKQILSSYEKAFLILNWPSSSSSPSPSLQLIHQAPPFAIVPVENAGEFPESPASINGSPRSEDFIDGSGSNNTHRQDYIFNSKKRKLLPKWTEKVTISPERGLEGPKDDVFSWRKYGQKDILGAKFPRSYYRCTHRSTQNCWATKQVQRSDSDPTVFQVTYRGTHTCSQATTPTASPRKQHIKPKPTTPTTTIVHNPKDILETLKTNLTVRTNELDDYCSFPDTSPFYSLNDNFSHVEGSQLFDVADWFNPTAEIDTSSSTFPTFLQESIFY